MKRKNISDEELLELYRVLGKTVIVAEELRKDGYDISDRAIRNRLANAYPGYWKKGFKLGKVAKKDESDKPIAAGIADAPDTRRKRLHGTRFVFTSAQNNTHIHEGFFNALVHYCKHNDAQLIVSRFTYNKSGFQNKTKDGVDELWYDPRLEPFFCDESVEITPDLIFCGELDILPTAGNPLSGFESYTQNASGIIPHAKVQMVSLPRLQNDPARMLYTTGTVTLRNYIQRKAGQKAEFHHVFGALLVEIDENGEWFARQLIADKSGTFHDLTNRYTEDGVETDWEVEAINWGDIHIEKIDPQVYKAGWDNPDSMVNVLKPKIQLIHDLTDFQARNHHNLGDPTFLARGHFNGTASVEADLQKSAVFLQNISADSVVVVVESNHDMAFHRWLREADVKKDPENARFYYECNALVHKWIEDGVDEQNNIYEHVIRKFTSLPGVIFLRENDSYLVKGIECGQHGHRGINGARGTSRAFRAIGRKCNLGHSHSAGIIDGVYTAGVVGKLDMGYNKGASSWSHSHILTYGNGKRAIVTMKNGKWRA